MSTIIVFSTKYGATKKAAEYLSSKIHNSILANLSENTPNISMFDNVIMGSPVYMGKVAKDFKDFFEQNYNLIKDKKSYIFISCGITQEYNQVLRNNLPLDISSYIDGTYCIGGQINPRKLSFADKIIYNIAASKMAGTNFAKINYESLDKIADAVLENEAQAKPQSES